MLYNQFCEEITNIIKPLIGEGYETSLKRVDKLNGVTLTSITIRRSGESISPTIYLEDYYNDYMQGKPMETIATEVINDYYNIPYFLDNSYSSFTDYELVCDRIFFKLINYEKNKELLTNLPHIKWMDLAIIFSVLVKKDHDGVGAFNIRNELMEQWNTTVDSLMEQAKQNTPLLFGTRIRPMNDIIHEILDQQTYTEGDIERNDEEDESLPHLDNVDNKACKMYVASNALGINGSSWLLFDNELRRLSHKLRSNLYILPSSIHECILIPATEDIQKDDLHNMVQEVNETQVSVQEVLSNNVYYYDYMQDNLLPLF